MFVGSPDPVPAQLRTKEFLLRPIVEADTERDYAAVMDTREALRLWRMSTWPEDEFTVEENRVDVVSMQERHDARRAYTYTVLDPSGADCLGCVYVYQTSATFLAKATVTPLGAERWADVECVVFFWARRGVMDAGTDENLLAALRSWFAGEWGFERTVFVTSAPFTQQVELFERAGMTRQFELQEPDAPDRRQVFGWRESARRDPADLAAAIERSERRFSGAGSFESADLVRSDHDSRR